MPHSKTRIRIDSATKTLLGVHTDKNLQQTLQTLGIIDANTKIESEDNFSVVLKNIYTKRFATLCSAIKYLTEVMPKVFLAVEEKNRLIAAVKTQKGKFNQALTEINDKNNTGRFQALLKQYASEIVAILASTCHISFFDAWQFLSKAEEYDNLLQGRGDLVTVSTIKLEKTTYTLVQVEAKSLPLSEKLQEELLALKNGKFPDWFKVMIPLEKRMLIQALEGIDDKSTLEEKFGSLSSRLRTFPGVSNFRSHRFYLLNDQKKVVLHDERTASSMVASRDMAYEDERIRLYHTKHNLEQIITQQLPHSLSAYWQEQKAKQKKEIRLPFLVQTLISPLPRGAQFITPDTALLEDKQKGIKAISQTYQDSGVHYALGEKSAQQVLVKLDIVSTNHPLNYGKLFGFTASNDAACEKLIDICKKYVEEHAESAKEVESILKEYTTVLTYGSWANALYQDVNGRELYLSSLEQLLVAKMHGIAYGSCVSGKDRKGLELIHTDAMAIYHHIYGQYPSYSAAVNSTERKNFIAIFAEIYVTRHHHESSGLNAPGAEGIKTPYVYLPFDMQEAIKEKYNSMQSSDETPLMTDDVIASNNSLKKIVAAQPVESKAFSPEQNDIPSQVLDGLGKLKAICENKAFWHAHTTYSMRQNLVTKSRLFTSDTHYCPYGIKKIRNFFVSAEHVNAQCLVTLSNIAREHRRDYIGSKYVRYKQTRQLYCLLDELAFAYDKKDMRSNVLCQIDAFYKKVMATPVLEDKEVADNLMPFPQAVLLLKRIEVIIFNNVYWNAKISTAKAAKEWIKSWTTNATYLPEGVQTMQNTFQQVDNYDIALLGRLKEACAKRGDKDNTYNRTGRYRITNRLYEAVIILSEHYNDEQKYEEIAQKLQGIETEIAGSKIAAEADNVVCAT